MKKNEDSQKPELTGEEVKKKLLETEKLLEPAAHLLGEIKKCEVERDEYLNGWKRAKADLINYQKDEAKRLSGALVLFEAGIAKDLIPVLESFNLGLADLKNKGAGDGGMAKIAAQFEEVLKRRGIKEIRAEKGERFNPEFHESVGERESDAPSDTVAEEISRGYEINGRVIKAARVMISKKNH